MTRWCMYSLLVALVSMSLGSAYAEGVTITQRDDKSYIVTAKTYTALIDATGNFASLAIDGVEMFGTAPIKGAAFPGGQPPTSINQRNLMIAIRNDKVRVEYTFDETGFTAESEGAALEYQLSNNITAYVCADGSAKEAKGYGIGDVRKVIAGKAAFSTSQPFHSIARKMRPSILAGRGGKAEALFKNRVECGISPDPAELLEVKSVTPDGMNPQQVPFYVKGETPIYTVELRNLGGADATVQLAYRLSSHYGGGKTLAEQELPAVTVKADTITLQKLSTPVTEPGCYWVNLEVRKDGKALKREQRAFVYEADQYKPALTRPADFTEFWKAKLQAMRAVPLDATATEVPEKSTEQAVHYVVELTLKPGQRVTVDLQAPRKAGKYLTYFGGKLGEKADKADQVILSVPHGFWPESATYTRWVSKDDNNLLDCYLTAVRLTDYLRSRPDVDRIYLSGGSRQGPIQLVNAALDPTRICAVDAHVPTSMGVSLLGYAYRGWGSVPKPIEMAAYVDPVNFAPDMVVPFLTDLGIYDGLSPVPGALAFVNYATKCPWKRLSVEPGGHGYFTSSFRRTTKAELDALVKAKADAGVDDKILKEH